MQPSYFNLHSVPVKKQKKIDHDEENTQFIIFLAEVAQIRSEELYK